MEERGLHQGLELRLETLTERIATLKRKMSAAAGIEKIKEFSELEELERRRKTLAEHLEALNREGPGFRQDVKAQLEKLAYDLTTSVEDAMMWIDSEYKGDRPAIGKREP